MSSASSQAYDYFTSRGYSSTQAAAIVGNLYVESNLDTTAKGDYRNGKPTAFGIAQWRGDRLKNFQNVIGKSVTNSNFEDQLKFIDWELNNTHTDAREALLKQSTVSGATSAFMNAYERPNKNPSINHIDTRINVAENIYGSKGGGILDGVKDALRKLPIPGMGGARVGDVINGADTAIAAGEVARDSIISWIPRIVSIVAGIILIGLAIAAITLKSDAISFPTK